LLTGIRRREHSARSVRHRHICADLPHHELLASACSECCMTGSISATTSLLVNMHVCVLHIYAHIHAEEPSVVRNSSEIAEETEPWLKSLVFNKRERKYFVNNLLRFVYIHIRPYVCINAFYTRRNTHSNTQDADTSKRTYTHIHTEHAPTQTYMHTKYVVCIHTYTDTHKHACTRILAYTHTHHTCMYACMQDICTDVFIHKHTYTYMHICIHANTHTDQHT